MLKRAVVGVLTGAILSGSALGLSLAPEEFQASRKMACVLAHQSLGQLSEEEYGAMTHSVLDAFDEAEQGNILAKALGYYDGLMFAIAESNVEQINVRLADFIASSTCAFDFQKATVSL